MRAYLEKANLMMCGKGSHEISEASPRILKRRRLRWIGHLERTENERQKEI